MDLEQAKNLTQEQIDTMDMAETQDAYDVLATNGLRSTEIALALHERFLVFWQEAEACNEYTYDESED